MTTQPSFIDAKLKRVIDGRIARQVTRTEGARETDFWRAFLPAAERQVNDQRPRLR